MFVAVEGARLFVDVLNPRLEIVAGGLKEKPTMVCLPGGPGGDHQTLRPWFDRFADHVQIVYLDPRGGGRSDAGAPADWTLDRWADDIATVCDQLGIDRPVLLGVSGGSIMIGAYLARHPTRAAGAILVNPCARMDREALIAGFGRLGGATVEAAARSMYTRGAPEDFAAFFQHCFPFWSARLDFAELRASAGRVRSNAAPSQNFFGPEGEAWRFDLRGRLGSVEGPCLLVSGELDPITRVEWGREVAEALPLGKGRLAEIAGASHLLTADASGVLEQEIRSFLAGLTT